METESRDGHLIPDKARVLSGSLLKLIAVFSMLIDHVGAVIVIRYPRVPLISLGSHTLTLYALMRFLGRMAFPLYAFLITEGFVHTGDRRKYALRLLLFALLSEVPFDLAFNGTWFAIKNQNVFFTLFLGFLGLCALDRFSGSGWKQLLSLLGLFLSALFLKCDYGVSGYGFILLMYALRKERILRAVIGAGYLSSRWKAGLAFLPIALYSGKRGFVRGRVWQYVFYVFYPGHLLLLYWISRQLFG